MDIERFTEELVRLLEEQVRPDEILGDYVYIYSSVDNEYHY